MTNPHDKAIEAAAEALLAAEWEDAGETPEDAAMIARSIMGGIADDSDDYARVARLAARAAIAAYERAMWRPIEEAPRESDGEDVIVVGGRYAEPTVVSSDGAWWALQKSDGSVVIPTHFRPLPPAPEGE